MNDQVEENQVTDDDWAAAMSEQAVSESSAEPAAASAPVFDQFGGVWPAGSSMAKALRLAEGKS